MIPGSKGDEPTVKKVSQTEREMAAEDDWSLDYDVAMNEIINTNQKATDGSRERLPEISKRPFLESKILSGNNSTAIWHLQEF